MHHFLFPSRKQGIQFRLQGLNGCGDDYITSVDLKLPSHIWFLSNNTQ